MQDGLLDVIVRFHDMRRYHELDRCIFSLVTQRYTPLCINLMVQRFSHADITELEKRVRVLLALNPGVHLNIINFEESEPKDARSRLLNMGLQRSHGRFAAFLDYDDTIYPESYQKLIQRLMRSRAAIAFGRVVVKHHEVFEDALIVRAKEAKFVGHNLIDLLHDNFCPIHSFVVDRSVISPEHLYFSELLSRLEDYDLLLRIVASHMSDFEAVTIPVGDYYFKDDGSNTVQISDTDMGKDLDDWARAREYIRVIKETTIIQPHVQRQMGIAEPIAGLTIARLLRARERWTHENPRT